MTVRSEAHRVCVITRAYPTTSFWVLMCGTLAAGSDANLFVLGPLLLCQLGLVTHLAHRMWSPPVLISLSHMDQPPTLLPVQRRPQSDRRHHRHARR